MDKNEARNIILGELAPYRNKPYSELILFIEDDIAYEKKGLSGTMYQIQIQFMWDSEEGGDIRVWGNIDDGGVRAFFPMTECFIKSPTGEFIDE